MHCKLSDRELSLQNNSGTFITILNIMAKV